jgi:iron complex outermembrane receptor protein
MIIRATAAMPAMAVSLACALAMSTWPALAEELETIVVTAQKREQSAQDVGISISAFSADDIRELGLLSSVDLAAMTPGVSLAGSYGGQFLTFSVRGVTQNDFLDHTEAPTSVYIDEAYMAMMTTQQFVMFDVDRVEILKGPQGTLFGRNSTGGTVNFTTRKPTDELDGYVDLNYARFDQARVEAAVGGPLSERVGGRVAVVYNSSSPILDNHYPGGGDLWADESFAGRAHLLFEINDSTNLLVTGYGGRSESPSSPWQWNGAIQVVNEDGQAINTIKAGPDETRECIGPGGANVDCGNDVLGSPDGFTLTRPVPGGDFFGYSERHAGLDVNQDVPDDDVNTLELYGGTANLTWEHGDLTLVSVTDYKVAKKDFQLDGTVSPARGINTIAQAETTSYSEELRLLGAADRWRWVTGVYYLNIDADVPTTGIWLPVDGNTPTIVVANFQGFQFLDTYELRTKSASLFGQVEFDLGDHFTAIGGVRVTDEKKDFDYRSDIYLQTSPQNPRTFSKGMFIAPTRAYQDDSSQTLVSARAELDWKPHDGLLVYGSFNRGVKAGGFNAPFAGGASIGDDDIPYDAETLNAYELGFKSTLAGGSTQLNGAAYFYDYRDYQSYQFIGLTSQVTNNDAEYHGAELEIVSQPVDGLYLKLSGSYLDTEVFDVVSFGITADKEASFAPEFQAAGVARYQWPLLGGVASVQASVNYSDSFYFSLTNFDAMEADSHVAFDGRVSYLLPDQRTEVALFVENIGDERYDTLGFDLSSSCGCSLATYAKPRVYGLSVHYGF